MSLLKSSFTVGFWTLSSRILGFLRDVVIANKLGASAASDAFFVALMLPNLLRRLFAEGAFNVAFVPLLAREQEKGDEARLAFISAVFSWLLVTVLAVCAVAMLAMPLVVAALVPGFVGDAEKFNLTVLLGRITFPYLGLITVAAFLGAVLNSARRFAAYAAVPLFLNLSFLAFLLLAPEGEQAAVFAASWAVPVGGLLQVAFMVWAFWVSGLKLSLKLPHKHPLLKPLLLRLGPAALGVGVLQVSFLIDNFLASFLYDKAISYLQYANRFYQLPLALIGIAVATVLLPHLSSALGKNDKKEAARSFESALVASLSLAFAAFAGLFILAHELMSTLFKHGEFTAAAAAATSWAMMAYSVGLPGYILTKITGSVFFAAEDTRTPLMCSAAALVVNVVANLILMQFMGHVGIALATAISGWFNAALQLVLLHKRQYFPVQYGQFMRPLGKALVGTLIMTVVLLGFEALVAYPQTGVMRFAWLGPAVALGGLTFAVVAETLKLFPLRRMVKRLL